MSFLEFAFGKDVLLRSAVENQQFWLFTPSCSQNQRWYIIGETDWALAARPGAKLGMSFDSSSEVNETNKTVDTDTLESEDVTSDRTVVSRDTTKDYMVCRPCLPDVGNDGLRVIRSIRGVTTGIKFRTPLPAWATYDPQTEFTML